MWDGLKKILRKQVDTTPKPFMTAPGTTWGPFERRALRALRHPHVRIQRGISKVSRAGPFKHLKVTVVLGLEQVDGRAASDEPMKRLESQMTHLSTASSVLFAIAWTKRGSMPEGRRRERDRPNAPRKFTPTELSPPSSGSVPSGPALCASSQWG